MMAAAREFGENRIVARRTKREMGDLIEDLVTELFARGDVGAGRVLSAVSGYLRGFHKRPFIDALAEFAVAHEAEVDAQETRDRLAAMTDEERQLYAADVDLVEAKRVGRPAAKRHVFIWRSAREIAGLRERGVPDITTADLLLREARRDLLPTISTEDFEAIERASVVHAEPDIFAKEVLRAIGIDSQPRNAASQKNYRDVKKRQAPYRRK